MQRTKVVYGRVPLSHTAGAVLLLVLAPAAYFTDLLVAGLVTTLVLVGVAVWEGCERRRTEPS